MLVLTGGDPLKRADLFELIGHARRPGLAGGADAFGHAAGHARGLRAGASRPAFGGWASVSTAPTPRRTTPSAAGKGSFERTHADARRRPRAGHARAGEHDDHAAQRPPDRRHGRAAGRRRGSPCGRSSSWCRSDAASRSSGSRRRSTRRCSSGCGITRNAQAVRGEDDRGPALSAVRAAAGRRPAGRPAGPAPDALPAAAATAPRWAWATARASCSSATPARSIPPASCRCAAGGSPRTRWSTSTRTTPRSSPCAIPTSFKGRCGICEYRHVCGGSRARAYAVTGDPLETEPDCVYIPASMR